MKAAIVIAAGIAALGLASTTTSQAAPSPPNGRVEGLLLDQQGQPLANVEVLAKPELHSGGVLARTRTDAEGVFVFGHLPCDGGCTMLAHVPGHTSAHGFALLDASQREAVVLLRAWQANTIRGHVLDADGKPIAGAEVLGSKDFADFHGPFLAAETRTNEQGHFELPGVPIGDCVLVAFAEGHGMRQHWLNTRDDAEVDVQLPRNGGTRLRIRVEGLPTTGEVPAMLRITPTRGIGFAMLSSFLQRQLDASNELLLEGLVDAKWSVTPSAAGYRFTPATAANKPGQQDTILKFDAWPTRTSVLRGTLRDDRDRALPKQRLLWRAREYNSAQPPVETITDAEGGFVFSAPIDEGETFTMQLVDSRWILDQPQAQRANGNALLHAPIAVWGDTANPTRLLHLTATAAAIVEARFVDETGRAVPSVHAELQVEFSYRQGKRWVMTAWGTSSRDGTLRFPAVHEPAADARIVAKGLSGAGKSSPLTLHANKPQTVTVVMQRAGRVEGIARDQTGKPLAGVRVALADCDRDANGLPATNWTRVPSDRDGRFVFVGVAPGDHSIEIGKDRKADGQGQTERFAVAPGATVTIDVKVTR